MAARAAPIGARGTPIAAGVLPFAERARVYALLMIAKFLYGWSWSTVDTLRPQLRAAVGASLSQVGALYSVLAVGALIGAVLLGRLGDRHGRRNVLAGVQVVAGAALLAGVFVADYPVLLAQRFALGLALGGIQPLVSSCYLGLFAPASLGKLLLLAPLLRLGLRDDRAIVSVGHRAAAGPAPRAP